MKEKEIKKVKEISAGGVVFDSFYENCKIILIKRRNKFWCLPKGKIEKGEKIYQAALREVKEETGVEADIIKKIDKINYWYHKSKNIKCFKTVYFYAMFFKSGCINSDSCEVDDVKWVNIDKALSDMSYDGEINIVKKAVKDIEELRAG